MGEESEQYSDKKYPIRELCRLGHIARAAYYKWLKHPKSEHELKNEKIAEKVKEVHDEHPDMGYHEKCLKAA